MMKALLPLKKAEVAEREKNLPRQVLQVEDPVWVWTIKYRRVAAFWRGYPLFSCLKMNEPFLLDTLDDNLWSDKEKEGTR